MQMKFKLALAQVESKRSAGKNLAAAAKIIEKAKQKGAQLLVFPELFMSSLPPDADLTQTQQHVESINGPFVTAMRELADRWQLWLVFGFREQSTSVSDSRVQNTVLVVDEAGEIQGVYHKTHLYDAFGTQESATVAPGEKLFEPIKTPFGKIGLFVCYELRFPEIARYQALHEADLIIVPAAWYQGKQKLNHWQTLVTARALENTVFVAACDQPAANQCIGHSLVVDPAGEILQQAGTQDQMLLATIDLQRISQVRQFLPAANQRRAELY